MTRNNHQVLWWHIVWGMKSLCTLTNGDTFSSNWSWTYPWWWRMESQLRMLLITGIFSNVFPLILPLWLWYVLGSIFVLIWNWLGNDWVSRAAAVQEQMHYHVFHYSGLSCCSSFRRRFRCSWCFSALTNMSFLNPQPLLFTVNAQPFLFNILYWLCQRLWIWVSVGRTVLSF